MYKTKLNDINLHIPELEPEISHPKVEPLKETTKKGKLVEVALSPKGLMFAQNVIM